MHEPASATSYADMQVDALVVASRGMGAFEAAMLALVGLGSVSKACVRRAPCPVIIVPLSDHTGA